MKNIGLLSGRSNKTFRVILVRVKYIEKYWNVNRVRKHSAIPSYCMNPMKIICWYIIFHTYRLSENYFFFFCWMLIFIYCFVKILFVWLNSRFAVRRKVFTLLTFNFTIQLFTATSLRKLSLSLSFFSFPFFFQLFFFLSHMHCS